MLQDFRFAIRMLAKKPSFTALVVFTLAVGIGANTAMFSILDSVILRPLPYKNPKSLTVIWGTLDRAPGEKVFPSFGDYQELKNHSSSFEDVAANTWAMTGQTLTWRGEPYRVTAIPSTANLFSFLGAQPTLGRTFNESDAANGCTVVLAHRFWQNQLGGTQEILHANLTLDEQNCTVVGVMSENFEFFPKQTELWTLILPGGVIAKDPTSGVAIFARLKPGVARSVAEAEVARLHQEVIRNAPAESWVRVMVPHVYDLQGEFTFLAGPNLRLGLLTLFGAVGMVLLIACVNVAGLLLSRGTKRQRELALRTALGCRRSRIIRYLLVESLIFAGAGAIAGIVIATSGVQYFRTINPIELPPGNPVGVNWRVLAFTAVLAALTGLISGLIPALKVSRTDLNELLKGSGASVASNWLSSMWGKALIIAEVAVSMVLLMGATLLIESIHRLMNAPLSFRADHLLTTHLALPRGDYTEVANRSRFYDSVVTKVAALPGIEAVALSSNAPLSGFNGTAITIAGRPAPASEVGDVGIEQVSHDFMSVMGIPLLQGRRFNSGDQENGEKVAIVNRRFTDQYFPNGDVLGRQIKIGLPNGSTPWLTIVGVVGNVERGDFFKEMGYRIPPLVYRPLTQSSGPGVSIIMRTKIDSKDVASLVREEIKRLDSRVPVHDFISVDALISKNFSQPRFRTVLLGIFAGIAVLLAAVGLYGVLMQAVVQRTRDIGIRMALGARTRDVLAMVIQQGITLTIAGIFTGVILSLYLTRFLASMLFGVTVTDATTLAIASAILIGVSLLSTYLPARCAARVDPILALKHE